MAYISRIGDMPAYTTVQNALKGLATHETLITKAHAKDPTKLGFLQFDNVQNYTQQRDHQIGRMNKMNIGIAVPIWLLSTSPNEKKLVLENKRSKLTINNLLSIIDQKHLDTVFTLHWLRVLVNSIPKLLKWKAHVKMLFIEKASKLQLPIIPTKVHPLASNGKNETVTTELKDVLFDFFDQMGQTESDYSGDGLTFQKMPEIQCYLQFHNDPFQSLALLEPVLSLWHTEWTDLSRVFKVHWDSLLSPDPLSLSHSTAKINRSGPSSLKKVDYYPATDLAYLILDGHILDCWQNYFKCDDIFAHFAKLDTLLEIEDLIKAAQVLHCTFSNTHAIYHALDDTTIESEWSKNIACGSAWIPPPVFESTLSDATKHSKKEKPITRHPQEMSYVIAEGDPGHVYEIMKILVFTFLGSSHTKYSSYLLETICWLELESSQALHGTILRTTLVNLTARAGSFSAADLMQEFFNQLLKAIVEKKGVEYGDTFIRQVISRNLHHFACIKLDLCAGVGLSQQSGHHSAPHLNPEIQILLATYQSSELHLRRPGWVYTDVDKDHFQAGITKLRDSKLKKWISETLNTCNLQSYTQHQLLDDECLSGDEEEWEELDLRLVLEPLVIGEVVDGELIFTLVEASALEIDNWISHLEDIPTEYSSGEESDVQSCYTWPLSLHSDAAVGAWDSPDKSGLPE
ncbi:hypothetical protein BYT27DRAFT_7214042 [Phlegmacium glaucopus]|nr:hypothetical protein BYT27DRAFT_7214042 [Phlegmacium glaucopus]